MAGKLHHLAQEKMATEGIINETLWLGLYTNEIELTRDKILSDLEELGGYTGYERYELLLEDWVNQVVAQATVFSQDERVWTFSFVPSEDITGYFITNGSMLIATEHFTLPVSPDRPGFEIKVTPVMAVR
jgi:hypothetical protein